MIKRTRAGYPFLAATDDPIHLEAIFGLEHATEREQQLLQGYRDPDAQAAFLLSVRCLAHLGYMPDLERIPEVVRAYVANQVGATFPVSYFRDRPARRTEIVAAARAVLDYQRWTEAQHDQVRELLVRLALDYPREADLVAAAVDRLQVARVELPVEDTLVTLAESALHQVEQATYADALRRADDKLHAAMARLLDSPEQEDTLLELVKRPPGKTGVRSMRREAEKFAELAKLGIPDDVLSALGQRKIIFLAEQAQRYTAADIQALSEQRRALILLAFVIRKQQLGRDMLLEQMDKILRRLTPPVQGRRSRRCSRGKRPPASAALSRHRF